MLVWVGLICWIFVVKLILGSLSSEMKKKNFLLISAIGLIFVMGSRYTDVALKGDLNNYARLYEKIATVEWKNIVGYSEMEPGYLLFNKLCSKFFPWKQSIIYIEAIVCVGLACRFIYKFCDDVFLGILFYMAHGLFIFQLTGFRQAFAISICLFAIEFIEKKKIISFVLSILVACTFHTTAIIFLPFYFVAKIKPSLKNILLYVSIYYLLLRFIPELLLWGSELTGSDYSVADSWGNFLGPFINIMIYGITLMLTFYINKNGNNIEPWKWNMSLVGLIIYLLRFVSLPFERVSFYFMGGTIATLPTVLRRPFNDRSKKSVYYFAIFSSIVLFLMRVRSTSGAYRFFWM